MLIFEAAYIRNNCALIRFFRLSFILIFALSSFFGSNFAISSSKESGNGLAVSKSNVSATDTIMINFPKKHPAKLAIRDPKDMWFVLHEPGVTTKLMTARQFSQATSLKLKVGDVSRVTWIDGKKTEKKVFSVPGDYMIYMADNLETEPENTFYLTTTINYK